MDANVVRQLYEYLTLNQHVGQKQSPVAASTVPYSAALPGSANAYALKQLFVIDQIS